MASLQDAIIKSPDYLLELFKKDIVRNLEEEAIAAIRPKITEAAKRATESLEGRIRAASDPYKEEVIVQLIIRDK